MNLNTEIIFRKLSAIERAVSGGGSTPLSAVVVASSTVNSNGSVSAGALAVTLTTSDDFAGTINGIARAASTAYVFNPTNGRTLPAIAYTFTAGSIIIDKITSA